MRPVFGFKAVTWPGANPPIALTDLALEFAVFKVIVLYLQR